VTIAISIMTLMITIVALMVRGLGRGMRGES